MTKRALAQLAQTKKEIRELEQRRRSMAQRATALEHVLGAAPGGGMKDRVGHYASELGYIDAMIDNAIKRCMHAYHEAFAFIEGVADSEMRQILRYRYLDGMSWQKVAFKIGEHDEQYPRRRHNAYMSACGIDE
jgi:hypothetical protein